MPTHQNDTGDAMSNNQFRIGGVYRNGCGELVALKPIRHAAHREMWEERFPGETFAVAIRIEDDWARGYISLRTGMYVDAMAMDDVAHPQSLLPGEQLVFSTPNDPTNWNVENTTERTRPALGYFTERTPFDHFPDLKGWTMKKGGAE